MENLTELTLPHLLLIPFLILFCLILSLVLLAYDNLLLSNNHFSWSAGSLKGLHAEILLHIFTMSRNSRINICLWKVLGKGLRVNYYGYIGVEWKIRTSHSLYCLCLDFYLPCCSRTLRGSGQSSSVAFRCVDASFQIEENITVSLRTKHCLNSEPSIRCAGYKIS